MKDSYNINVGSALPVPPPAHTEVSGGTGRRLLTRTFRLLIAVALLVKGASAFGDTVELLDGSRLRGKVVDLGGNSVAIGTHGARKTVLKREIRHVTFSTEEASRKLDRDLLVRRTGDELYGKVTLSEDPQSYVVEQEDGSRVTLSRGDVLKVVFRGEVESQQALVYTKDVEKRIEAAIEELSAEDSEVAARAEKRLKTFGIFAIPRIEETLKSEASSSKNFPREALERVRRLHQMKKLASTKLEEEEPRLYEILDSDDVEKKILLLNAILTRFLEDSLPLARYLLLDPSADSLLRARIVSIVQGLQLNHELVDLYHRSSGQVQLAVAIALGENRLLIGVPTLIEALDMEERAVRALAADNLRVLTGFDPGYHPDDLPAVRQKAMEAWWEWWRDRQEDIVGQTRALLAGKSEETEARRKAKRLWNRAGAAMHAGRLKQAEEMLREAVALDPFFLNPHISLAVLLYTKMGRLGEARDILEDLISRPFVGVEDRSLSWVYYHRGKIYEVQNLSKKAMIEYQRCLEADKLFFRAHIAIGKLRYAQATRSQGPTPTEREKDLRIATKSFQTAIKLIEKIQDQLVLLYRQDLPLEDLPPFDMREHNRMVLSVKASLRLLKARCLFEMAKAESLLGPGDRGAVRTLVKAVELLSDDEDKAATELLLEVQNYLGLLYENLGEYSLAYKAYRRALELDRSSVNAQAGLDRTERRLPPKRRRSR